MRYARIAVWTLVGGVLLIAAAAYSDMVYLKMFNFNDEKEFRQWKKMVLNGEVNYSLIKEGDEGFLRALSEKACSALYYRIGFKLDEYPLLFWNWRAVKFPDLTGAKEPKDRDDYAARVYVIFPFLSFSSSRFIEYIWAEEIPEGTVMTSPLAGNVKMIVIRSGVLKDAAWASECRNMYEDYIRAFGEKPARSAGAIAVMCDADNSKSEAESFFHNIAIGTPLGERRRLE